MHFIKAKQILSPKNGLNIYRGCTHGCIYCDARSSCYQMDHEFTDIAVKDNALKLLTESLLKKKDKVMIGTGAMSDPYMPIESKLLYTRGMLEIIHRHGHGISIQTKSDLILRDLDLLIKINEKARAIVNITLTTADDSLCQILEPYVCTTKRRVEVLKILANHNIETIVWLCPFLPFINDTLENLNTLLNYCLEAGVKSILCVGIGLTLREGNREYFYQKLDEHFPGMKQKYIQNYGNSYQVNSSQNDILYNYFIQFCKTHNIEYNIDKIFKNMRTLTINKGYPKISLFD